jgi:hypothetical protein
MKIKVSKHTSKCAKSRIFYSLNSLLVEESFAVILFGYFTNDSYFVCNLFVHISLKDFSLQILAQKKKVIYFVQNF